MGGGCKPDAVQRASAQPALARLFLRYAAAGVMPVERRVSPGSAVRSLDRLAATRGRSRP